MPTQKIADLPLWMRLAFGTVLGAVLTMLGSAAFSLITWSRGTDVTMTSLKATVDRNTEGIERMNHTYEKGLDELRADQKRILESITKQSIDLSGMQSDLSHMREDIADLKKK